ncbi:MAG: hypothetical protein IPL29_02970 [Propionivibrio sp.]|uniref:hypothetical protein n=1 Tax=Propionivibrio sp. TaxID=2212460 RepID=UPI0025E3171A|nr:hypothetical protein [Propionivibrio sp.]MBK8400053.1 hypothetical protein [Propionivibrio sp.]MBK8893744.1 hypothetical protein [Propionivibrio sp.]
MNSIKLCTLVVSAALAAPVFAQKTLPGADTLLVVPKPSVIPKLDLPPPPPVLPAKPASALNTTGMLPAADTKGLGGAAIAPLNLRPDNVAPPESGHIVDLKIPAPPGADERGGASGGAFAGAKAKTAGPEGGELLPAVDRKDLGGAAVSSSDLKPNIDLKGLSAQRPDGSGATDPKTTQPGSGEGGSGGAFAGTKARMMGLEGEKGGELSNSLMMGEGKSVGNGAKEALTNFVGDTGPIKGDKYGDTFGGDRVNRKSQGSLDSFTGGGKGRTSEEGGTSVIVDRPGNNNDTPEVTKEKNAGAARLLKNAGGEPTGVWKDDIKEADYAMRAGPDAYAATKNMTGEQRAAFWAAREYAQKMGTKRPTEDSMGATGGPMTRDEFKINQRGMAGRTGGAGGSNDGRGEQDSTPSATGGGIAVVNKADGPERVEGVGTLNMDAALKINTLVNPGAR